MAAVAVASSIVAEATFNPRPVRVVVPTMNPTAAQAAPIARAFLVPHSRQSMTCSIFIRPSFNNSPTTMTKKFAPEGGTPGFHSLLQEEKQKSNGDDPPYPVGNKPPFRHAPIKTGLPQ